MGKLEVRIFTRLLYLLNKQFKNNLKLKTNAGNYNSSFEWPPKRPLIYFASISIDFRRPKTYMYGCTAVRMKRLSE